MKTYFVAACLLCWSAILLAAETPPNILFAIADDWSVHSGAYGTRWTTTPTLDRVAREGLRFTNAYTPMAKCAPSRAIILTGRQLWQNEEAGNHLAYFPAKLTAWPEVLTKQGWNMGYTGKGWGPGIAKNVAGKPRQLTGKSYSTRKAKPLASGMSNLDYAGNFVDFLDAAPAKTPWCFWYGCYEPHRGYEAGSGQAQGRKKPQDIERVPSYWPDTELVRNDILDYAVEVEHFENHLARMVAELEKRGQLENTLIIVTSDHGMPFPRVKGYAYHDSNHVPLLIRWPGKINNPGRVIDDFVDFTDLAPTILAAAGIDATTSGMLPITGQPWQPIFASDKAGRVVPERDHVLVGKERTDVGRPHDWGYPIRGIATADYLYLRNAEPTRWPAGNPETGYLDTDASPTKTLILELGRMNRADKYWQLNFGMRPAEELYDLREDPDCIHNLAAETRHAKQLAELKERLDKKLREQSDPRIAGNGHIFDEYPATSGRGFYDSYLRGEKPKAGWASPTDAEPESLEAQLSK